jgi:hypothetical protein
MHQRLMVAGVHSRHWHLTAATNNGNGSALTMVMNNGCSEQGHLILATVFDGVQRQQGNSQ